MLYYFYVLCCTLRLMSVDLVCNSQPVELFFFPLWLGYQINFLCRRVSTIHSNRCIWNYQGWARDWDVLVLRWSRDVQTSRWSCVLSWLNLSTSRSHLGLENSSRLRSLDETRHFGVFCRRNNNKILKPSLGNFNTPWAWNFTYCHKIINIECDTWLLMTSF